MSPWSNKPFSYPLPKEFGACSSNPPIDFLPQVYYGNCLLLVVSLLSIARQPSKPRYALEPIVGERGRKGEDVSGEERLTKRTVAVDAQGPCIGAKDTEEGICRFGAI
jgi:hypothetical protein